MPSAIARPLAHRLGVLRADLARDQQRDRARAPADRRAASPAARRTGRRRRRAGGSPAAAARRASGPATSTSASVTAASFAGTAGERLRGAGDGVAEGACRRTRRARRGSPAARACAVDAGHVVEQQRSCPAFASRSPRLSTVDSRRFDALSIACAAAVQRAVGERADDHDAGCGSSRRSRTSSVSPAMGRRSCAIAVGWTSARRLSHGRAPRE